MITRVFPVTKRSKSQLEENLERKIQFALDRFWPMIQRLEVHMKDVNGPRGGEDKLCTIRARLLTRRTLVACARSDDWLDAATGASRKIQQLMARFLAKRRSTRRKKMRSFARDVEANSIEANSAAKVAL